MDERRAWLRRQCESSPVVPGKSSDEPKRCSTTRPRAGGLARPRRGRVLQARGRRHPRGPLDRDHRPAASRGSDGRVPRPAARACDGGRQDRVGGRPRPPPRRLRVRTRGLRPGDRRHRPSGLRLRLAEARAGGARTTPTRTPGGAAGRCHRDAAAPRPEGDRGDLPGGADRRGHGLQGRLPRAHVLEPLLRRLQRLRRLLHPQPLHLQPLLPLASGCSVTSRRSRS